MSAECFYVTTPIYYVNAKPHIGHAYTSIAADALARYHRLCGKRVLALTGTDEHGQKVAKAAAEASVTPREFTDRISATFRDLWTEFGLSFDDFIRTTEPRHRSAVEKFWKLLDERGQIYKALYRGWYCTPCETFFTERQVLAEAGAKVCPDCKRPVEQIEEENFFLKTSQYQAWLREHIMAHPDFIQPDIRRNEVLGFLDNNTLQDLCISRPAGRLSWGIPSPLSATHVTYVWFDALINYVTACGFADDAGRFAQWWPADVHLVGKDILRHHAVYWPIMLKAAGMEVPRQIFAHGWWVQGGQKMSKSLGNVVDPLEVARRYGFDAFRYFLLREVPFGFDGSFSEEALVNRFNHDLANDLGNLLHRSLSMCEKYFGGEIPVGVSVAVTVGVAVGVCEEL
ncbi:MAG: methionine--tRNA ligase, partial [Candidatus Omnitrophota bacterium]